MFTDLVKPGKTKEFETWLTEIHNITKEFEGFISVDMIRPTDLSILEYITLVKFDSYENLMVWKESPITAKCVEKLPDLIITALEAQEATGLQLWFDRPIAHLKSKEPPFWKQAVVGVICVYPLIIFLNWVLAPVTGWLPGEIVLLISVIILSGLLTYPVMPWVTRLLRSWLYPD